MKNLAQCVEKEKKIVNSKLKHAMPNIENFVVVKFYNFH